MASTHAMGPGTPLKRREDPRFLTGASRFTADVVPEGAAHAVVVRSPHAHAIVRRIDTAAARAAPGALLVLTAADVVSEIPRPIPSFAWTPPFDIRGRDGRPAPDAEQYPLARERARDAGEPVALDRAAHVARAEIVKGAGESAATGAPAAVMNAVRDAPHAAGVRHADMPVTREQVWRALARDKRDR